MTSEFFYLAPPVLVWRLVLVVLMRFGEEMMGRMERKKAIAVGVAAVLVVGVVGCEVLPEVRKLLPERLPEVQPAVWANYQHEYAPAGGCAEFSQKQAQSVLGVDRELLVTGVIQDTSAYGETIFSECAFSDPQDHEQQVIYSRFRLDPGHPSWGREALGIHRVAKKESDKPTGPAYREEYPGFGHVNVMDQWGHQTALWFCGNQAVTAATRIKDANPTGRTKALWEQLRPAIEAACGTVAKPRPITATDDGKRPDVARDEAQKAGLAGKTIATGDSDEKVTTVADESLIPEESWRKKRVECPWFSPTEAGELNGTLSSKWKHFVLEEVVWVSGRGESLNCQVVGPLRAAHGGQASSGESYHFASFDLFALTYPSNTTQVYHPNEYAAAHLDPLQRSPYVGKYHGFGVLMPRPGGVRQVVWWMCRAHMVKIEFVLLKSTKKISSEQLWSFAEPAISEVCGLAGRPSTPAFNEDYYRIDHTKLYMKDWRLLSDNPRRKPPEKLSYQIPW